jgi:Zn ribbon nucleic-acid-binding protein
MEDINCPYCNTEQDIDHDDGYGYEENELHQQECSECGKNFVYNTSISYYYSVNKADCLNDGEHDFQPTHTYPKEFTKMRCTMCGEERRPTDEEMKEILK